MPASEYETWLEYHNRIPFTSERLEILLASLIAVTYNMNIDPAVTPLKSPMDFLTWLADRPTITQATAVETTMQPAAVTDQINREALIFKAKLAKVTNA